MWIDLAALKSASAVYGGGGDNSGASDGGDMHGSVSQWQRYPQQGRPTPTRGGLRRAPLSIAASAAEAATTVRLRIFIATLP